MTHVSGILNILECKLYESTLKEVQRYSNFYPTMDLITSKANAQLPTFLACRTDPETYKINEFVYHG